MRDIFQVIENIIEITDKNNEEMTYKLKKLKNDCAYTAPEDMQRRWYSFGAIFNTYVPFPPTEKWQKKAINIFTGREEFVCD